MMDLDNVPWKTTRYEGVSIHFLESNRESGYAAVLIRMAPGCSYPTHRHLDSEELMVLQGRYRDHLGVHNEGSFHRYEPGSVHHPRCPEDCEEPCVLFAIARGGIEILDDSRESN